MAVNFNQIQDFDEFKLLLKNQLIDDTHGTLADLATMIEPKRNNTSNMSFLFQGRLNMLQKEARSGVLTKEEERVESNRLRAALISFVDTLESNDLKPEVWQNIYAPITPEFEELPNYLEEAGEDTPPEFAEESGEIPETDPEAAEPTPSREPVANAPIVALLLFPNDDSLGSLQDEERAVQSALLHFRKAGGNIEVVTISSVDEFFTYFNLYKGQIGLIHYGGHASSEGLFIDGSEAKAKGLAQLMGTEPNLEFVFLNGCGTAAQVSLLQAHNVKAVLATSVPVSDTRAMNFAVHFYQNLAYFNPTNTLQEAFNKAKAYMDTTQIQPIEIEQKRGGFGFGEQPVISSFKWGLYENPKFESVANWKLPRQGVTKATVATAKPLLFGAPAAKPSDNEERITALKKKIAHFEARILSGELTPEQELAYFDRVNVMLAELKTLEK